MGEIIVECLYPELVTTNVNDSVNAAAPFFRLLQSNAPYGSSKVIDNVKANIPLVRYAPV